MWEKEEKRREEEIVIGEEEKKKKKKENGGEEEERKRKEDAGEESSGGKEGESRSDAGEEGEEVRVKGKGCGVLGEVKEECGDVIGEGEAFGDVGKGSGGGVGEAKSLGEGSLGKKAKGSERARVSGNLGRKKEVVVAPESDREATGEPGVARNGAEDGEIAARVVVKGEEDLGNKEEEKDGSKEKG